MLNCSLSFVFNVTEWINNNDIDLEDIKNYIIKLRSVGKHTYYDKDIIGNGIFRYLSH